MRKERFCRSVGRRASRRRHPERRERAYSLETRARPALCSGAREQRDRFDVRRVREHVEDPGGREVVTVLADEGRRVPRERDGVAGHVADPLDAAEVVGGENLGGAGARRVEQDLRPGSGRDRGNAFGRKQVGRGEIAVSLVSEGGRNVFAVRDSGSGIREDGKSGLGTRIMAALTRQIDGEWSLGSSMTGGTLFTLSWPA